jgi:hypothetical protein
MIWAIPAIALHGVGVILMSVRADFLVEFDQADETERRALLAKASLCTMSAIFLHVCGVLLMMWSGR